MLIGAIVEIKDGKAEQRLGTGTVISDDGSVLTCHHVIGARDHVTLVHHASGRKEVVPILQRDVSVDFDLAILRTSWTDIPLLPLAFLVENGDWNARGYQDHSLGYKDVVQLTGRYVRAGTRTYHLGSRYEIAETFDLWGDAIHGGTSGAALVDCASGCIIGVISASLTKDLTLTQVRAIAVALRVPKVAWPPFASLTEHIGETVPRFGQHLNSLGTLLLCCAQRQATIADLIAAGLINQQRLVERDGLTQALAGFLASQRVVMPIVGPSGNGKTSIAAFIADKMGQSHALLLRGVHMQATDADISLQIERALLDTDQGTYGLDDILRSDLPRPSAKVLASCAAGTGKPLLIVLDAINERDDDAIPARRLAEQWFPRTIRWLHDNKARLIVTCRSETWRLLLPPNINGSIFPPRRDDDPAWRPPPGLSHAPEGGFWIDDLTDHEIKEMTTVYGLKDTTIDPRALRHPFVMRLAAEAINRREAPEDEPSISEIDLLERAVAARIAAVARRTSANATGEAQVETLVKEVALAMVTRGTDRLPGTVAAGLPLANPKLLQYLADEGVLESVGQDYRFRFDQYADMERSHALVLPLKVDLSAVASHLAEPAMWSSINVAAHRMMKEEVARWYGIIGVAARALANRVVETRAPVELRLGLLLEITRRNRDGYGVRVKDWHDNEYYGLKLDTWLHYAGIDTELRALHMEDGQAVLRTLVLRLTDDRPLLGGESREGSISSFCGGCICALNDPRLEFHYAELFNSRIWITISVLEVTLRQRHNQLVSWMLRALSAPEESSTLTLDGKLAAIRLLRDIGRNMSVDQRQQAAVALQPRLSDADHNVRAAAASAILEFEPSSTTALDQLLRAMQPDRTDNEFDAAVVELNIIPPDKVEDVLHLILKRLDRSAEQWYVWSFGFARHAVHRLRSAEFDPFAAVIADFFLRHAGEDKEADRDIVEWATCVICRLNSTGQAYKQVIALIDRMVKSGNDRVYLPLVDAVYGSSREKWPNVSQAIQCLIEPHALDANARYWMLVHCMQNSEPASDRVAMAAVYRLHDLEGWDSTVVHEMLLFHHDEPWAFAATVVDYWRSLPPTALTTLSRKILALLDGGESLRRAFQLSAGY